MIITVYDYDNSMIKKWDHYSWYQSSDWGI